MYHATVKYNIHRAQHGIATVGHHVERVKSHLTPGQAAALKDYIGRIEAILSQAERDEDQRRKRNELEGYSL